MKTSSQLRLSVPARPPLPSSSVRQYPSFPYTPSSVTKALPFSPAATPTPSKRAGAKPWLPWVCTLLQVASLYWLNNAVDPSLSSVPLTFVALLLSAGVTALQQRQSPRNRPLTATAQQRATLAVDGALLAMVFLLRFAGCRACGPMEAVLAELAGALAGKALLDSQKSPDHRGRKLRGAVALTAVIFFLSRGWDRAGCFPMGTYDGGTCSRLFRLAAPLAAGLMASLEKSCANRSSIRHLGKRRVRLTSLSIAAGSLFPFAVFTFFFGDSNSGHLYGSSAFWPLIGFVSLGVVSSFYSETYCEEKLLRPPLSPTPFFITVCCSFVLELVFGLELSLLGFLLCSVILWIAIRDLGSPSSWLGHSILESDPSDAFFSLVRNPLHHILSERKSRKIAIFLLINTAFMAVEFIYGFMSNSLGLISDACHMLFDCAALAIGLYASYISRLPANGKFNYGYGRFEVLSGYVNAVFLVLVGSLIVLESLERILDPQEISTESLLLVSVGGLLVNIVGLVFFHEEHHHAHGHSHTGCSHSESHSHGSYSHGHSHDAHDHSHTCTIQTETCGFENSEERGSNSSNHLCEDHDVLKRGRNQMSYMHGCQDENQDHGEISQQSLHDHSCNGDSHIGHQQHKLVTPSHEHDEHTYECAHDKKQCEHDHLGEGDGSMHKELGKDRCLPHHSDDHHHSHSHGHSHLEHSHSHGHSHLEHSHSHDHSHLEHSHSHGRNHSAERHKSKDHRHIDHNMEGIFLHVLADTLGSVGVVASTLLIKYKGWLIADPACSIFISILIISSVIPLFRNAAEILLQRVPRAQEHGIKQAFNEIHKIQGVHDLQNVHVWNFTNKEVVGTLHLHICAESDKNSIGARVAHLLSDAGIKDLTLQMEHVGNS